MLVVDLISLLKPFNCKILVNDIINLKNVENNLVKRVEKDAIFFESDIISIHTPLNKETKNLFNLEVFKKMKKTSFLIPKTPSPQFFEPSLINLLFN